MLPSTINRIWQRARKAIGRTDLFYHDLRHSGLTWAAASGASIAELMRRGGHANPTAALRYQHATEDRDCAIADALADLEAASVTTVEAPPDRGCTNPETEGLEADLRTARRALVPTRRPCRPRGPEWVPRTSGLPIRAGTLGLEIRTYAGPPTFLLSDPVLQLPAPVAHQRTP